MRYMNNHDIEEARRRWGNHAVLTPAIRTLTNLRAWTDQNSDGWAYWQKPVRAAEKLMALIEGDDHPEQRRGAMFDDVREDATPEKLKAALRPIKSFRTRVASPLSGEDANFVICETLEDVRAQDVENNDLKRRAHIALAQQIANEYDVTITPEVT